MRLRGRTRFIVFPLLVGGLAALAIAFDPRFALSVAIFAAIMWVYLRILGVSI